MQPISNYLHLEYKSRWWRLGRKSMNSQSNTGEKIRHDFSDPELRWYKIEAIDINKLPKIL